MSDLQTQQSVVVTDIRMPFWSMVVFIVKLTIAAIPAIILLSLIATASFFVFAGLASSVSQKNTVVDLSSIYASEPAARQSPLPRVPPGPGHDRCVGSPEPEKCMEIERRLASESPEEKLARQNALESERRANMEKIR